MSRNKTRRLQKGGAVHYSVEESVWLNEFVDTNIFGSMPLLVEDNMNQTYINRREHLTNWICQLLLTASIKSTFLICNEKKTKMSNDSKIKGNIYLSPISTNAQSIQNLTFVDYYAFDYGSESDVMNAQTDPKFLESPQFIFNESKYVDISKYGFHQMNASGNDNSCGFFTLLQAISPLYRSLNYPAKIYITRQFRNSYVPQIIVNKNGAPMSTREYRSSSMGGTNTENELNVIRASYNGYDSETRDNIKYIEYLRGHKNTDFTGVTMHKNNSWFFGFNMVSISARTQEGVNGKYKFQKDNILGPERVTETILICNMNSAHYMTICKKKPDGKIIFVFDETDSETKKMIDDITIDGSATDVVKTIETGLTFENYDIDNVCRKILNDQVQKLTIDINLYKPKDGTTVFPKGLDFSLMQLKIYGDNESQLGDDLEKILCLAFNHNTNKYYYVISYNIISSDKKNNPIIEQYNVASINQTTNQLIVSDNYNPCGTIQFNNEEGTLDINLDGCDLSSASAATTTATATTPPAPTPTTATTTATTTSKLTTASTTATLLPPPRRPPPSTKTANNIQCPVIIKFSNDKKDVEVVDMNVDSTKCNDTTFKRLPFDSTQIVDGTQYLTFVTFDQDDLFVTGVDFTIQNSAKCDNNLQNILNTSISTVVSGGVSSSVSSSGGVSSTVVGISSVPATAAIGGGGGIVATTPTTVSNPATTNFNPKNGDWIMFHQNYYKIESFIKTVDKYTINYEYNSIKNKKYKYSPIKSIELTCKPNTCSVVTDTKLIKKLDDLPIETK